MISEVAVERPLSRSPVSILIDDPSPGINPLYYFASTVPPHSTFYHYASKGGKWYFSSDKTFSHPIAERVDPRFVREFAEWVRETDVKGKVSVVPYAAGLGRIDGEIKGVPPGQVSEFVRAISSIAGKFDVSSELLTHTRAVNLKTMKLMNISEHDWSQRQTFEALAPYITLSLEMLRKAGLDGNGVTSPCDFGAKVEGEYAMAVLAAAKRVRKSGLAWYFLHVDAESLVVPHRLMHFNRETREAVVSIVASMNDPFWTSMSSDESEEEWVEKSLEPILSSDGRKGRIAQQVAAGSWVAAVTHWQSLYANGTRYGLRGLKELVRRINLSLAHKMVWMSCSEITRYIACASAAVPRVVDDGKLLEVSSPFQCSNLTLSFRTTHVPKKILCGGKALRRVSGPLSRGSWSFEDGKATASIPELNETKGRYLAKLSVI